MAVRPGTRARDACTRGSRERADGCGAGVLDVCGALRALDSASTRNSHPAMTTKEHPHATLPRTDPAATRCHGFDLARIRRRHCESELRSPPPGDSRPPRNTIIQEAPHESHSADRPRPTRARPRTRLPDAPTSSTPSRAPGGCTPSEGDELTRIQAALDGDVSVERLYRPSPRTSRACPGDARRERRLRPQVWSLRIAEGNRGRSGPSA